MVRLLAAILITCCLTAQLTAQASTGQTSTGQTSMGQTSKDQTSTDQTSKDQDSKDQAAKDERAAGQTSAVPSAKTGWPLDAFPEFSAVMVGSMMPDDGGESYIYRSGKLLRNTGPQGLTHPFVITDLTTGESYAVAVTGCMHDNHPYVRSVPFSMMGPDAKVERVAAGQETVDGHSCKIEDVTISSKKFMKPFKLKFWEADDLQGFPVKIQFVRGFGHDPVIRYKNVVLGPQDPTLFTYPNSCEKSPGFGAKTKAAPAAKKPAAAPPSTPQN